MVLEASDLAWLAHESDVPDEETPIAALLSGWAEWPARLSPVYDRQHGRSRSTSRPDFAC